MASEDESERVLIGKQAQTVCLSITVGYIRSVNTEANRITYKYLFCYSWMATHWESSNGLLEVCGDFFFLWMP